MIKICRLLHTCHQFWDATAMQRWQSIVSGPISINRCSKAFDVNYNNFPQLDSPKQKNFLQLELSYHYSFFQFMMQSHAHEYDEHHHHPHTNSQEGIISFNCTPFFSFCLFVLLKKNYSILIFILQY